MTIAERGPSRLDDEARDTASPPTLGLPVRVVLLDTSATARPGRPPVLSWRGRGGAPIQMLPMQDGRWFAVLAQDAFSDELRSGAEPWLLAFRVEAGRGMVPADPDGRPLSFVPSPLVAKDATGPAPRDEVLVEVTLDRFVELPRATGP